MSLKNSEFDAARELIARGESFVVATHGRPDPDTIGSSLALARGIRQLGKKVIVLSQDGVPDICDYLPDAANVLAATSERGFDVGIICDADGLDRIGTSADAVASSKSILIVDHHVPDAEPEGDSYTRLVDTKAAATAEVVFQLLDYLGAAIDRETAVQLMAGLVGDTGGFRFANVTSQTLVIASQLTAFGASPGEAAREIYENRSPVNARLLGLALVRAHIDIDSAIVWSSITRQDFAEYGATDADTDSIVNSLRGVRGAKVGVLFREIGLSEVRVSLRSREGVDVNRIARAFDGGGHVSAAGCTLKTGLADAEQAVLAEVRKCMVS